MTSLRNLQRNQRVVLAIATITLLLMTLHLNVPTWSNKELIQSKESTWISNHLKIVFKVLPATSHLMNKWFNWSASKLQMGHKVFGISILRWSRFLLVGNLFRLIFPTRIFTFWRKISFHILKMDPLDIFFINRSSSI